MTDDQRDHRRDHGPSWGMNAGWAVLSTLISGMVVWGGVGWLIDWWLGTRFVVAIGVVLGAAGGLILVMRKMISDSSQ